MFSHITVALTAHREESNLQHWAFKSIYIILQLWLTSLSSSDADSKDLNYLTRFSDARGQRVFSLLYTDYGTLGECSLCRACIGLYSSTKTQ